MTFTGAVAPAMPTTSSSMVAPRGVRPAGSLLRGGIALDHASMMGSRRCIAGAPVLPGAFSPSRIARKAAMVTAGKGTHLPPIAAIRNSTGSWRSQDQWSTSQKTSISSFSSYAKNNQDTVLGGFVLVALAAAASYVYVTPSRGKKPSVPGSIMDALQRTKDSLSNDVRGIKQELLGSSSSRPAAASAKPRSPAKPAPARSAVPAARARAAAVPAMENGGDAIAELVSTQIVLPEIGELQGNIYNLFNDESLADLQFIVRSTDSKSIMDQARTSSEGMDPKRLRSVTLKGSVDVSSIEALNTQGLLVGGTNKQVPAIPNNRTWELVKAHKLVVAAASEPLRRVILETEKLAAGQLHSPAGLEIVLEGTPVWALKAVLEFAYTGRARARADNVIELCAVARQLEMHSLESLCTKWLISRLDVNKCALWITQSELLQLPEVHRATSNFAPAHFEAVSQTESFLGLNLGLMVKLIGDDKVYAPSGEEAVFEALLRWLERTPEKERFSAAKELLPLVRFPLMRSESLVMLQAQVQDGNVPVVNEMAPLLQPLLLEAAMFQMATTKQKLQLTTSSPGLGMRVARRRSLSQQDSSGWAVQTVLTEVSVGGSGGERVGSRLIGPGQAPVTAGLSSGDYPGDDYPDEGEEEAR